MYRTDWKSHQCFICKEYGFGPYMIIKSINKKENRCDKCYHKKRMWLKEQAKKIIKLVITPMKKIVLHIFIEVLKEVFKNIF